MITRESVRNQLQAYLNHRLTLKQLVDWAENAMVDGEFDPKDVEVLSDIVGRIGVADVEDYGLSWEDISQILSRLGYNVNVQVMAA
jgi:hypothetical protein